MPRFRRQASSVEGRALGECDGQGVQGGLEREKVEEGGVKVRGGGGELVSPQRSIRGSLGVHPSLSGEEEVALGEGSPRPPPSPLPLPVLRRSTCTTAGVNSNPYRLPRSAVSPLGGWEQHLQG